MANASLADFLPFINQCIKSQEQLESNLENIEALLTVPLLVSDFYELPKHLLYRYFSIAADLTKQVSLVNQSNIEELLAQNK